MRESVKRFVRGAAVVAAFIAPQAAHAACNDPPAPKVQWQGCKKPGVTLENLNLQEANLEYADFTGARLYGPKLATANLRGIRSSYANFTGADLRGADLSGANLSNANFSNANLIGADLRGAFIDKANFKGAKIGSATWTNGDTCHAHSMDKCIPLQWCKLGPLGRCIPD